MKKAAAAIGLVIFLFTLAGCVSYSFTGASIPPNAKTISIQYFENKAALVEPTLSQSLTDALRDRFQSQTPLNLVTNGGDLQIEGVITDYTTRPQAIQENDKAATNRLTVQIKVKFTNTLDPSKDYESSFSRFEDYSSTQDLNQVKDQLIALITDALVEDVFNKSVVNW